MNIQAQIVPKPRTLAHVLLDISDAGPIIWDSSPEARAKWASLDCDGKGEALDRLDALQAEARALIEAATGVPWDVIQEACL